jgi:sec-independent protein translocase protein TatA
MFITVPSGPQWLIILLIFLLIFGAHRLPDIAGSIGTAIRRFRESYRGDKPGRDDHSSRP